MLVFGDVEVFYVRLVIYSWCGDCDFVSWYVGELVVIFVVGLCGGVGFEKLFDVCVVD